MHKNLQTIFLQLVMWVCFIYQILNFIILISILVIFVIKFIFHIVVIFLLVFLNLFLLTSFNELHYGLKISLS